MIIVDNEMCECGAEKQVKEGRIIPEFICHRVWRFRDLYDVWLDVW